MRYETLLLTRHEQQDYSALVRPQEMSDADVTTLNKVFNAAGYAGRLREDCPALYCFPVGEYAVLVRHYGSESRHQGAVVEGAAVKLAAGGIDTATAAKLVAEQANLLNVSGTISDIESHSVYAADEREIDATFENVTPAPFAAEFLERREQERLFLPFTAEGRGMLAAVLTDKRFDAPPYFAFGTNSDVLAQLERLASIDIASFVKTERVSLRDRKTSQVMRYLDEGSGEPDYEAARTQRMQIYAKPKSDRDDAGRYEDTRIGSQAMPIQSFRRNDGAEATNEDDAYDPDDTVLTIQQIPAGTPRNGAEESNPLRRVTKKLSSLLSPRKTE